MEGKTVHVLIVYPVLLAAAQYATDVFWRYIFEDLAYGRCPYQVYIHKNYLCGMKGREFCYKIEIEKDPCVLYHEIFSLLSQKAGILSDKEKILEKERVHKTVLHQEELTYSMIKKRILREMLMEQFIIYKSIQYEFSYRISEMLLSLITIGLCFKTISVSDIFYEKGRIESICGIFFQPKKVIVTKNVYRSSETDLTKTTTALQDRNAMKRPNTKLYMSDEWRQFIVLLHH